MRVAFSQTGWRIMAVVFVAAGLSACGSGFKPGADSDEGSGTVHADQPVGSGLAGKLVLTGSSTVAPVMLEIGKRFETLHPDVRVDVQTGGSSRGIGDAKKGLADLGMASRALKADEAVDLQAHLLAQDGVCVILHKDNPVAELSKQQVFDIYTGKVTNWSTVGGPDAKITVVNKASGRATLEVFVGYFGIEEKAIQADVIIGDNEQGVKTVSGNPHAIGYVSIGTAEYNARHGVPIKLLPMAGVEASTANLATGAFPISRPLNLVTKGAPAGLTMALIAYAQSDQVHDIIRDLYLVPVTKEKK